VDACAATISIAVHRSRMLTIYNVNHHTGWICVSIETTKKKKKEIKKCTSVKN
jgi:hypothetical protein